MADLVDMRTAGLDELLLDANNPRLGRRKVEQGLSQEQVLDIMKDWTLEELAVSFLESGFWAQEALIVVKEKVGKKEGLVVVEGNRRLAALKMLDRARSGGDTSPKWKELVRRVNTTAFKRLEKIPYVLMPDRRSVQSYLGFRHVTGIKEWKPAEKAQFIAHLIEDERLSYDHVRRRIGSRLPTVRQNYISYRILLQMEEHDDKISVENVEDRFSVLYLSLRTEGVQKYLQIDINAEPASAREPVPAKRLNQLASFALWLFGNDKQVPIFSDSRDVDAFGNILLSDKAIEYLERTPQPSFEVARRMAGVSESEVAKHVETAADELEEALKAAHHHKQSSRVQAAVERLGADAIQLLGVFPAIKKKILKEEE